MTHYLPTFPINFFCHYFCENENFERRRISPKIYQKREAPESGNVHNKKGLLSSCKNSAIKNGYSIILWESRNIQKY